MMAGQNVYTALAFVFLSVLPSCVRSDITNLNLCHNKIVTSDRVDINMDTSLIAGQVGSCSCRVFFKQSTELVLSVHNLTSPHCATSVSLSGFDLKTTCIDSHIQPVVYSITFNNGSGLWIVVWTNGSSPEPMSGFIQLRTQYSTNLSLQCFEPIISQPLSTQIPQLLSTTRTTRTTTTPPPPTRTTRTTGKTTSTITTTIITITTATTADGTTTSSTTIIPAQSMHSTTVGRTESAKLSTTIPDSKEELPVSAIAGSIVCVVGVVIIIIIAGVVFHRRYKCIRRPAKGPLTPESREHPTYSDLTNRENTEYLSINLPAESAATSESEAHPTYCDYINRENTVYEHIDQSKSDNVYKNIAFA